MREPGADLAVAAALVSSLTGIVLPTDAVFFGEIALSGTVRSIGQTDQRLKESAKLGLGQAVIATGQDCACPDGFVLKKIEDLSALAAWIASRRETSVAGPVLISR